MQRLLSRSVRLVGRSTFLLPHLIHISSKPSLCFPLDTFSMQTRSMSHSASIEEGLYGKHYHARSQNKDYPKRVPVSDEQVDWNTPFEDYTPQDYTAENVLKKSKDPFDVNQLSLDELKKRETHEKEGFKVDEKSHRPLNPRGRTGLAGRGKLYNWGPNQAADPIITRKNERGELEVVVIKRGDSGTWAFPGGMVDPGEKPSTTVRREFGEEAMAKEDTKSAEIKRLLDSVFNEKNQQILYRGYVDDPRNTDNSWLETTAIHHHLSSDISHQLSPHLSAGDDAKEVRWLNAENEREVESLYANHKYLLAAAKERIEKSKL